LLPNAGKGDLTAELTRRACSTGQMSYTSCKVHAGMAGTAKRVQKYILHDNITLASSRRLLMTGHWNATHNAGNAERTRKDSSILIRAAQYRQQQSITSGYGRVDITHQTLPMFGMSLRLHRPPLFHVTVATRTLFRPSASTPANQRGFSRSSFLVLIRCIPVPSRCFLSTV